MSFDLDERQVLRLAMAANGPVNPLPAGSSVTVDHLQEIRWKQHLTNAERQERLEQVRRILRALDNDDDLDERMKSRGMFSVSDLIQGTEIVKWTAHTDVNFKAMKARMSAALNNDKETVQ